MLSANMDQVKLNEILSTEMDLDKNVFPWSQNSLLLWVFDKPRTNVRMTKTNMAWLNMGAAVAIHRYWLSWNARMWAWQFFI